MESGGRRRRKSEEENKGGYKEDGEWEGMEGTMCKNTKGNRNIKKTLIL